MQTLCLQIFKSPGEVLTGGSWSCHLLMRTSRVRPLKCHSVDAECPISTFLGSFLTISGGVSCFSSHNLLLSLSAVVCVWKEMKMSNWCAGCRWAVLHMISAQSLCGENFCMLASDSFHVLSQLKHFDPLLSLFLIVGLFKFFFFFKSCNRFLDAGKSICMNCRVHEMPLIILDDRQQRWGIC